MLVVVELDDLTGQVGLERSVVVGQVGKGVRRHGGPPLQGTMGTGCTLSGRSGPAHAVAPLPRGRHPSRPSWVWTERRVSCCTHGLRGTSCRPRPARAGGRAHPPRRGELTLEWFRSELLHIDRKGDGTPVTAPTGRPSASSARSSADPPPRRRHPRRGGGRHRSARAAGAGSSTRSTAPRPSPTACRSTPTCWPSRTSTASPSASSTCPALGETVYAGRGLGLLLQRRARPASATATDLRRRLPHHQRLRTTGPTPCSGAAAAPRLNLRTWGDGYGYVLVATGRHRGHGRPDRRALRPRPDAGDHRRGRRPLHRPRRRRHAGRRSRPGQQRPHPRRAARRC